MKKMITLALLTISIVSTSAFALSLSEAKNQGLVGELNTGYLGIVDKSSSEAQNLVDEINEKRKNKYRSISSKNNQPISVVEKIAAEKILRKASKGHYIKKNGGWTQK